MESPETALPWVSRGNYLARQILVPWTFLWKAKLPHAHSNSSLSLLGKSHESGIFSQSHGVIRDSLQHYRPFIDEPSCPYSFAFIVPPGIQTVLVPLACESGKKKTSPSRNPPKWIVFTLLPTHTEATSRTELSQPGKEAIVDKVKWFSYSFNIALLGFAFAWSSTASELVSEVLVFWSTYWYTALILLYCCFWFTPTQVHTPRLSCLAWVKQNSCPVNDLCYPQAKRAAYGSCHLSECVFFPPPAFHLLLFQTIVLAFGCALNCSHSPKQIDPSC